LYRDILILSNLVHRPSYGYEIKKSVQSILGQDSAINNNHLYPALRRFEEMGAVEKEVERQEGKPDRHVYRATDLGREILRELLREFTPQMALNDAEFQVRVAFFGSIEPEERLRILSAREEVLRRRLEHLLGVTRDAQGSEQYPYATQVVEFQKVQVQHELKWLGELTAREIR
jgi:DNA-binding PadR family transcriptional regulator